MAKIPNSVIKEIAKSSGMKISNDAATKIAKILEDKAMEIANFAVGKAKSKKRNTVLAEDVDAYRLSKHAR
ncbi:MAG: NFYB/HAP3 family transcription factor subunit [Candidatus Micrarchaeaceae archaeon]